MVSYERDDEGAELFVERDCQEEELGAFVPSTEEREIARTIHAESHKQDRILRLHHWNGTLRIDWTRQSRAASL